eukprot:8688068-Pyramimonas_sp.AAC.1
MGDGLVMQRLPGVRDQIVLLQIGWGIVGAVKVPWRAVRSAFVGPSSERRRRQVSFAIANANGFRIDSTQEYVAAVRCCNCKKPQLALLNIL